MNGRHSAKETKPYKVKWLYECFGLSKQAYHQKINTKKTKEIQAEIIKKLIEPIRKKMPRYGGEKLWLDIKDDLQKNDIKMGRDQFMTFLREHHLLVKKTKKHHITTNSKHFYYKSPNLIKDLVPTYAEQVFVNDITYVDIDGQHGYLALVTDWFSKRIMGYKLDDNMRVSLTKDALEMAVKNRIYTHPNIIHHSDRGIQYCCPDYSEFAQKRGMILSTTQQYDPYENVTTERINGIIKYEFGFIKKLPSMEVAQKMIVQAIEIYNHERRHKLLNMKTPAQAHKENNHQHKFYKKIKLQKSET